MPALHNLESLFAAVQKPARYTGGEWNSIVKDWDACDVRVVLAYPDLYDIGMSNMGLGILYDIINHREGMLAERVFAPWSDMEQAMRAEGVPLWSLESRHPLAEFDVIGFSLSATRARTPTSSTCSTWRVCPCWPRSAPTRTR